MRNQVITAVCTDARGVLWYGTQDGLFSFDGYRALRVGELNVPASVQEYITDLEPFEVGGRHLLWVASKKGSRLFDPAARQFLPANVAGLSEDFLRDCTQLEKCGDGSFVALRQDGLYRLRLLPAGFFDIQMWMHVPPEEWTILYMEPANPDIAWLLYFGSTIALAANGSLTYFNCGTPKVHIPSVQGVFQLIRAPTGELVTWDQSRRLYLWNKNCQFLGEGSATLSLESLLPGLKGVDQFTKQKPIVRVFKALEGEQWVLGTNMGLFIVRKKPVKFQNLKAFNGDEVRGILTDSLGNWWAGTYTYLGQGSVRSPEIRKNSAVPAVWAFLPLGGDEWLLALEHKIGFFVWNKRTDTFTPAPLISEKPQPYNILSLCRDYRNNIWAGSYQGLYSAPADTPLAFRPFRPPGQHTPFQAHYIRALLADSDSSLWIGSEDGLFRLRLAAGSAARMDTLLPGVLISDLHADQEHNIWIASKGKGLGLYQKQNKRFSWFTEENGLCNNSVCRIESSDQGRVFWISTHNGLSRFDTRTRIFHNYHEEDGFPGNEFNSAASAQFPDGSMLFGGVNGMIYFHPDSLRPSNFKHRTIVTHIRVYNQQTGNLQILPLGNEKVELPPYPQFVEFLLGVNYFTNSSQIHFRYRLLGLASAAGWDYTGEHDIKYFQLPPGEYTFEAQAVVPDGHLGPPVRITFFVSQPYYERWWFRGLALATLLALAYAGYSYRLRQILKEQRIRQQIADDLHDDIGNKLNIISILAQKIAGKLRQAGVAGQQDSLDKLKSVSHDTLLSLHNMIWSVDPQKDQLVNLFNRMQDFADEYLRPLNIRFSFTLPEHIPHRELNLKVRHHVMLIYQELLTNMIKHTQPATLGIEINLLSEATLQITLINTFQASPNPSYTTVSARRGLESLERRLHQIQGQIKQLDVYPQGQKLVLSVPWIFKK
ncbi:MAG: hypothetical protein IT262_09655 [Saprospiraceae bacterium]|nr:hypothetical protein [Saprospiraceae bacterium]